MGVLPAITAGVDESLKERTGTILFLASFITVKFLLGGTDKEFSDEHPAGEDQKS